jgi:hypothetical protein
LPSPFTKLLPAASSNCHSLLILLGLTTLAQTFNQPLTDKAAAAAYVASLSPLTKEQLVQAFSRALDEAKLLPVPALLRDFASIGKPVAVAANESADGSRALTMWPLGRVGTRE